LIWTKVWHLFAPARFGYVRTYQLPSITTIQDGRNNGDLRSRNFTMYPIPANEVLNSDRQCRGSTEYKIMTTCGRMVLAGHMNASNKQIDISSTPPDVYILRIGQQQQKINKPQVHFKG
jgi:hypothetical protein